ncbi:MULTISPECIES: hypothetical protein [Enterobacterales]|uniref:hypothetical protein n=1 Tax=Enterobacterales TaxID=91347 RepID=UPI002EDB817A
MSIIGWYYLHENGDLIYKPGSDSITDIRDSDFARCSWSVDVTDRRAAWEMLVEASALGARESRVNELAEKWHCDDADADMFASVIGVVLVPDGSQWCAHSKDFVDLQESSAGFGDSKLLAMVDLARQLGIRGGHMWRSTFSELVKGASA